MTKMLSAKVVRSNITTCVTNVKDADKLIHGVAVQCLMHARLPPKPGDERDPTKHGHGDVSLFADLYNGLRGTGYNRNGLLLWVNEFSPIRVNRAKSVKNGETAFSLAKEKVNLDYKPFDIEKAEKTPFNEMQKVQAQQEPKDFGPAQVVASLKAMAKRISTAVEENRWPASIDEAQTYIAEINGEVDKFNKMEAAKRVAAVHAAPAAQPEGGKDLGTNETVAGPAEVASFVEDHGSPHTA